MRHISIKQAVSEEFTPNEFCECDVDHLLGQLRDLTVRLSGVLSTPDGVPEGALHTQVENILRLRKQRNKLFGGGLFGEPAWDMLLELYAAERSGRKLSISGACYVSGVPMSTALRWILRLEKDGWIRRVDDPLDARRSWLTLCDETEKKMCEFLRLMASTAL